MEYQFLPTKKVYYGENIVSEKLKEEIEQLNSKRILIVTAGSLINSDSLQSILRNLTEFKNLIVKSTQHVPSRFLMKEIDLIYSFKPNLILSFGGGSSIDMAKVLSMVLTENIKTEDDLFKYSANQNAKKPKMQQTIPHFSIPTTLSAAEFTSIAGVTNSQDSNKYAFSHPDLTPAVIFLDPKLTMDTPLDLWISTGMRSVDHAVETIYSPKINPINESLALQALDKLYHFLPLSKAYPDSLEYRLNCQIGAWMSLFSNINIKLGLSHSIGHQLGSHYNIPHGLTSAIMLPHVMEILAPVTYEEQAKIFNALNTENRDLNNRDKTEQAKNSIKNLIIKLELPHCLRDFNVSKDSLSKVVEGISMDIEGEDNKLVKELNLTKDDMLALLEKAW